MIAFISQYISLTEEEKEIIKGQNLIRFYPKGRILLSEGDLSQDCYFVLKGCVRSYYLVDGEERSTEFYTENQGITPVSYLRKEASEYYLDCLEDSYLALGSEERNKNLMEAVPKLSAMLLQMSNDTLIENQLLFDDFKKLKPEMRYLKLMETRPELFRRVPLNHIATYLGITPVSLSRMRKRISDKA